MIQHFTNSTLIDDAIDLICQYHSRQIRKLGKHSYLIHLFDVATMIHRDFLEKATPELISAALCHDLLEDTKCAKEELGSVCGKTVLKIVLGVIENPDFNDRKDWELKKKDYLNRVEKASQESKIVCLYDKISNLKSVLNEHEKQGKQIWGKFNREKKEKLWFEKECHAMLSRYLDLPAIERYRQMISEMEKLK